MTLIRTMEEAEPVLKRLWDSKLYCIDTETSGLDWRHNHIVGYVLTFGPAPQDTFYLPVRHAGGGNIPGCHVPEEPTGWNGDDHPVEMELREILHDPSRSRTAFGHNLPFDLKFAHRHGINLGRHLEDTAVNAALLDEFARSYSLASLCEEAQVAAKKGDPLYEHMAEQFGGAPDRNQMANYWRTNAAEPIVWEYAAGDGTSTWQLRSHQIPRIHDEELTKVWGVENSLIPVLHRMMMRGIRIDEERLHEVQNWVIQQRDEALTRLPQDFNPRAPTHVRKVLEDAGHTDHPKNASGKGFSFNEAYLSSLPIGQDIIKVRKFANLNSSFLTPLIERHLHKGRVHPTFHQLRGDEFGTVTGRLSASDPNVQQIHKRNKELGMIFRAIFIPDYGMKWGSVDYSQCEPRLLAIYSKCRVLLDGFRAVPHVDAHTAVANAAGIERQAGKVLNQTLLTGGGQNRILEDLAKYGVSEADGRQIWRDYFTAMPEIRDFQKDASKRMRINGYVKSLLGRRARLERPGMDYKAVNRILQPGNADIIKLKMVEVDRYLESEGDQTNLLLNCHDALEYQFLPENRHQFEEAMRIMTDFGPSCMIRLPIPMGVDGGVGDNWAEATWLGEKAYVQSEVNIPRKAA